MENDIYGLTYIFIFYSQQVDGKSLLCRRAREMFDGWKVTNEKGSECMDLMKLFRLAFCWF